MTRPPRGPGTAPLMSSRFLSPSTACTVRLCTVVRSEPIRPAIRTPLNTRPGVAQAPIEPGERCLRWVPCEADRPLKPCRFMTPAVPLPLDLPVTSTRWPAANSSAVSSWPSVYSDAPSVRISAPWRPARLLKQARHRLGDLAGVDLPEADLDSGVAVVVRGADSRDHARACQHYRDRHYLPGFVEDLGHAKLGAQDPCHSH